MEDAFRDLLQRMWITRGARYNAYRRLKKKHDLSIATIAFLSSYVLIINSIIFVNFLPLKSHQTSYITFFTIVISVLILVLSLIDSSKDYKMNADRLHISAIEIENLYNELQRVRLMTVSSREKARKFHAVSGAYSRILQLYQVNHELIDYYIMTMDEKEDTMWEILAGKLIYARAFVLPFLFYNLLIVTTPVFFLIFLFMVK